MRMNAPLMTDLLQPSEFGQELLAFCLMPKIQSILQESARESNDVVSLGMTSSPIEDIVMYNNSSDSGTMETLTWLRGDNVTLPANMTMPPPLPLEDETAARQDVWDQPTISKGLEQDPFTVQHWTQISAVVNAGKNIPSRPILSAPGAAEENVRCAEKPYLIFTKETLDRFSTYNYVACNTLCELDGQCRATVFNKEEESAHQQCRLYRNCFPVKSTSKDKTSYKFGPSLKKTYPVDGYCSLSKICQGPLPTNPADGLCNLGAKNCESCGGKYCVI